MLYIVIIIIIIIIQCYIILDKGRRLLDEDGSSWGQGCAGGAKIGWSRIGPENMPRQSPEEACLFFFHLLFLLLLL